METEAAFHFLYPLWLLGLPVPLILWLWPVSYDFSRQSLQLNDYADAHLLPHLTQPCHHYHSHRGQLLGWGFLWILAILAMAGPRWDYEAVAVQKPNIDTFILFDISRSMVVTDDSVERIVLARQEVDDFLRLAEGKMRVGLIAFASVSQLISPLTDDFSTLHQTLSLLSPELVNMQGSRLLPALSRVQQLLANHESYTSILLVTDGDFIEDGSLEQQILQLNDLGISLNVLGVGSTQGGVVPGLNSSQLSFYGLGTVVSKLDEGRLQRFAEIGGGIYQQSTYAESDVKAILAQILRESNRTKSKVLDEREQSLQIWHERFYWLVGLMLILLLPWFRRETSI